jgi:hypothetical protein
MDGHELVRLPRFQLSFELASPLLTGSSFRNMFIVGKLTPINTEAPIVICGPWIFHGPLLFKLFAP